MGNTDSFAVSHTYFDAGDEGALNSGTMCGHELHAEHRLRICQGYPLGLYTRMYDTFRLMRCSGVTVN